MWMNAIRLEKCKGTINIEVVGKWWSPTKETLTSEDFHQILLFLTFSVHVVVFSPKSILSVRNSIFFQYHII